MRLKANGELRMSWFAFVNMSPEAVMKLVSNGATYRESIVERHPQSKGFRSYRSIKTGRKVKGVVVV